MIQNNSFTLVNPQTGNLAFQLFYLEKNNPFDQIQRLNYYSMIGIENGTGTVRADYSEYNFKGNLLFPFLLINPLYFI